MNVTCWYCQQQFTPQPRDPELVIAWVNTGRRKGANAPVIRHQFNIWAHADCVKYPGQQGLQLTTPPLEDIL